MKRSTLKRKTPLKASTPLRRKTPLKASQGRKDFPQGLASVKPKKAKKGLSGQGRSQSDIVWHGRVAGTGCFACNLLGQSTKLPLRIHHPQGRNKGKNGDLCEKTVICLCDDHHDPSINPLSDRNQPSVHGNKKLFRSLIGTEAFCVFETYKLLNEKPLWLQSIDWNKYVNLDENQEKEAWILNYGGLKSKI